MGADGNDLAMNVNRQTSDLLPPSDGLGAAPRTVLTARQLRALGVTPAVLAERSRTGGPWRQVLPQVYLLHPGAPSGEERVRAALLYAGQHTRAGGPAALVTGPAALALHHFGAVVAPAGPPVIDVLVPHQRRLRDAGDVRIHRVRELPRPHDVGGLPCAPVARALADTVAGLDDTEAVRRLLTEAVRRGHCDPVSVLRELSAAGLLERPCVAAALPALRAAGRRTAEQRLYTMARCGQLPDPAWNVDLRLPGGPPLGAVDAFWPEHGVAVVVDARIGAADDAAEWDRCVRLREQLEALGVTVVHLTLAKLRDALDQQATVVRTALVASADRTPAAYLVVTPR
ncbi:hypothetical protein GA0115240_16848 [Streptomyces sp. DvalAA-14]|uniref:hypothetical protein n=1 Tax=unclassified Streptomyces TaxID=2593676 RepID=UPI00081B3021|nr:MULTISPECIES: hypothetical protein [unclassified Streptomyces]SCE48913.1 hypothetical protein GA0115240_16848 [Streptomyces sp. DvalAA-14]